MRECAVTGAPSFFWRRAVNTGSFIWVDANGNKTILRVNSGSTPSTLATLAEGCSNAGILEYWESAITVPATPVPFAAAYQSVVDRAVLLFLCADNTLANLIIPAPSLAVFMSDGETIDITNPNVSVLVTAAIGDLQNLSGSPAVAFVSG